MSSNPISLLPAWLIEFRAIAVALLTKEGSLVEANEGFLSVIGDLPYDSASALFIDPPFFALVKREPAADGTLHKGLVTLGKLKGVRRSFSGNIYLRGQMILLVAEMDISAFERMSSEIEHLSQNLDKVQAQLMRRTETLQKILEENQKLKGQDTLTGLSIRSKLDERLDREIKSWERYRRPLSLMILDIDEFREINANYGRETGDEILTHVATVINESVRALDLTVRYGGNEFALLLPETNEMGALIVAERLRMELEGQIILPMVKPITISIGVATLLPDESRTDFCKRVERAVRTAKEHGRKHVTMAGVIGESDHVYENMNEERNDNDV